MYDLGFCDLIWYVAYVYYPGWLVVGGFVEFDLEIFFILIKHIGLQKGGRADFHGPHASRTHGYGYFADRRQTTGRIQFAVKGRGDCRTGPERMEMRWGQLSSYYLPHFSRIE
jgi:hypothetical protein